MIVFPNAKINLGLSVVSKRADGYHNLETVFYPVPLEDALEVVSLPPENGEMRTQLHQYGNVIEGNPEDNLVMRAYALLAADFKLPPVDIYLLKYIPSGAGLGGGSSDAAFMIRLLNDFFTLRLTDVQMEGYAALLGADCAFFIKNRPVYAEGIGNIFSPVSLSLAGYRIVVVKPDIFVSTRDAFSNISPHDPVQHVKDVVERPVAEWREYLVNDFESSVFPLYPVIGEIKEELYRKGALYAAMSGSGSAVFGLFQKNASLPDLDFGKEAFVFTSVLR